MHHVTVLGSWPKRIARRMLSRLQLLGDVLQTSVLGDQVQGRSCAVRKEEVPERTVWSGNRCIHRTEQLTPPTEVSPRGRRLGFHTG